MSSKMTHQVAGMAILLILSLCLRAALPQCWAQEAARQSPGGVLLEFPNFGPIPGSPEPSLGPGPGALEPGMLAPETGFLGGRRRAGRIPRPNKARPMATETALAQRPAMSLPAPLPEPATTRSLASPSIVEDEGAPEGLTLEAAIEQMLATNLDILALKYEIPQADADVLTASLRTNPLFYMDEQFIPYGAFTSARPGGPTQYDISITYPIDVTHKRKARTRVAREAKTVLEAQFQDVIRRQIGNLYRAFVDLQSARINYLSAQAAVRSQVQVVATAHRQSQKKKDDKEGSAERLEIVLEKARVSLEETRDTLGDAQEALAVLLSLPPEQTAMLQPRGSLRDRAPAPPPLDELTQMALERRPDVIAARRGIGRAQAELSLQHANRLDDVFLFYDPLTYQDNSPSKLKSGRSWVLAMTFPLPIYNRNQGNIAKAHSNIHQTQTELAALERRVVSEVRLADREYRSSRQALERIERIVLPGARAALERNSRDFAAGKITPDDYLGHLDDDAEAARSFREALIRHRRSMLDLNTAIGLRMLP